MKQSKESVLFFRELKGLDTEVVLHIRNYLKFLVCDDVWERQFNLLVG